MNKGGELNLISVLYAIDSLRHLLYNNLEQ